MAEVTTQVSSSINALMKEFNIITHNLANISTAGYKRRCNAFSKSLEAQLAGGEKELGGDIAWNTSLDFSQGGMVETGRPLDFALNGKGFFVIETANGPLYTRNGTFQMNRNGQLVNSQGQAVAGDGGPITIPGGLAPSQLSVSEDGTISSDGVTVGKFGLVDFGDNEGKLVPAGMSCFSMPDEDVVPQAATNVSVRQGYQESSNVKMVDELVNMIMVSRLYEANMKFITAKKEAASSLMSVAMG
jgi:flagellar basal-body rod protein FlgF